MRRAVLTLAIAVGLLSGFAAPTSAIGLTQVTLSCDDGTTSTMTVDANTLVGLTSAVQAMIDHPAGLSCAIAQMPVVGVGGIALASPGKSPFIVGGGRWQVTCLALGLGIGGGGVPGGTIARVAGSWSSLGAAQTDDLVWVNIAVNVHQADDGTFFGTLNETIPANQSCPGGPAGESHFTSKPTCVLIADSTAFVTSRVTQTSGQRAFPADETGVVTVGDYVHFGFADNGNPPGQNPSGMPPTDMLAGPPATPEGTQTQDCDPAQWDPAFHLGEFFGTKQYGNISVHQ